MKVIALTLMTVTIAISCNKNPHGVRQGYRENQEAVTQPNDYTSGKDVKVVPDKPAERAPEERREKPRQTQ